MEKTGGKSAAQVKQTPVSPSEHGGSFEVYPDQGERQVKGQVRHSSVRAHLAEGKRDRLK